MNLKKSLFAYISVMMAMVFWSLSFIWYKQGFVYYLPVTIIFLRLLMAVPMLFTLSFVIRKLMRIHRTHLAWFVLVGFLEPFLYFMGESFGIRLLSPTTASVIISTVPLFAPIAATYFFREKFTTVNYIGLIVSFTGVILILTSDGKLAFTQITGVLLMLLAVLSAVLYSVFVKKLVRYYNPLTIVTYQSVFGLLFFIPVFLFTELSHFLNVQHSLTSLLPVIKLAVFASSFAFVLFVFSIKNLGVAKTVVFANFIPVLTAVFSYFLLNESFPPVKIIGIIIVISGLMFSQIRNFEIRN